MKLQILIPQYKETDDIVKPLLDSIALQQGIDFDDIGVIICNDGSDVFLSDNLIHSYPYKVEYHREPHRGVSATRNACLEYAIADYVMFCDADDMFCDMRGLWVILDEMTKGFDFLASCFVEESRSALIREPLFIERENDCTFVHGKVYSRHFLNYYGIRWNDDLTIHEDSFFNVQCKAFAENYKYIEKPYYLWKWRDDSVCRHDPKYILKTYVNMIDSSDALIEALTTKGAPEKTTYIAMHLIYEVYYMLNKPEWKDAENSMHRDSVEKRFANYYAKYKRIWSKVSVQEKMIVSQEVRDRQIKEGMQMESMTIDAWLKHIEETYNNDQSDDEH